MVKMGLFVKAMVSVGAPPQKRGQELLWRERLTTKVLIDHSKGLPNPVLFFQECLGDREGVLHLESWLHVCKLGFAGVQNYISCRPISQMLGIWLVQILHSNAQKHVCELLILSICLCSETPHFLFEYKLT